jgi:hypothetical protein
VFDFLTKYLLQYKRVSIPSVGTIRLVQQPAQLDIANKLILPPSYKAEISGEDDVSEHQLDFLASCLNQEKETIWQSLDELGHRLGERMKEEGFDWKGIGVIHSSNERIAVLSTETMEPVVAEKLIRQDAEHRVLVGDQHLTSTQIAGLKEERVESKRSVLLIIGWVILFLSVLYIIFVLWQGKFHVGATGSKTAPTSFIRHSVSGSLNPLCA